MKWDQVRQVRHGNSTVLGCMISYVAKDTDCIDNIDHDLLTYSEDSQFSQRRLTSEHPLT